MIFALKRQYQRLCMSRDLNGQRTKRAIHISVSLSSKRWNMGSCAQAANA